MSSPPLTGRIFLSPISVQEYLDKGENIPIDILFSGDSPLISFRVPNGSLEGHVPITNRDLQKAIYENGQRYIKKWDLKLKSTKLTRQRTALIFGTIVALVFTAGAAYWLGTLKNRPSVPTGTF